ncbi:MAG: D-amino acid aminotransferase [Sideroxydans sp.]|nr:D-amino acid aminotransferase [Sideroxydans sp.]
MDVYLNGVFMPIEEARVPVLDRGFMFGDGVYEVIPVYARRAFRMREHLQRLQHSLDGIRLPNPHTTEEWETILETMIAQLTLDDHYLYLHITRGVAKRDHPFPVPPVPPTVFVMSSPLPHPSAEQVARGVDCITVQDNRWLRCDIKAISLLPNVLMRQASVDAGCGEAILIRDDSFLTEGSASNIFVVKNGVLLAPPKDHLMLPGITYDVILELAAAHGIKAEIRKIMKEELFSADELILTSSTREVMPITSLDGHAIGDGKPGAVFAQLHPLYQTFKKEIMRK